MRTRTSTGLSQHSLKPALISTYDTHGAGTAAWRLYQGLKRIGAAPQFLAHRRTHPEALTLQGLMTRPERWWFDRVLRHNQLVSQQNQRLGAVFWSDNRQTHSGVFRLNQLRADIVNLHWIGLGLIPIPALSRIRAPIVWTLHDSWAFTGGCHVPLNCTRYMAGCGQCPQLQSHVIDDDSHRIFKAKEHHWQRVPLTIVTPSRWLAERAGHSRLLGQKRIEVIPNGIDLTQYRVLPKPAARAALGLSPDRRYILTGSLNPTGDYNKGFDLLQATVYRLAQQVPSDSVQLLIMGAEEPPNPPDMGLPIRYLGYIEGATRLNQAYASADVFVLPSRQENLPNVIMEALASGTPCVAFDVGGNGEMIDPQRNGFLVPPYDTAYLAHGIRWVLDHDHPTVLQQAARRTVEEHHNIEAIAKQYADLFAHLKLQTR